MLLQKCSRSPSQQNKTISQRPSASLKSIKAPAQSLVECFHGLLRAAKLKRTRNFMASSAALFDDHHSPCNQDATASSSLLQAP